MTNVNSSISTGPFSSADLLLKVQGGGLVCLSVLVCVNQLLGH